MKISIVLVDDHAMFLEGMSSVLSTQENMEVLLATKSVESALTFLKKEQPELLITDISMPEMNGVEFIKILNERYPDLKIIVVSMFKQIQNLKGISGYLLKETSYEELIKAIELIVLKNENYYTESKKISTDDDIVFNKSILSKREKEVVKLIANELTTDQIAEKLFLSKHTVETHKKNIFLKLQVNNAAGLIKKAMYFGYIT